MLGAFAVMRKVPMPKNADLQGKLRVIENEN
jgi:hypothetical protein